MFQTYLHQPVQREPVEKDVREELDNAEQGENYPVHQPLGVIGLGRRFNSFHRGVCWVHEPDGVAQELGSIAKD